MVLAEDVTFINKASIQRAFNQLANGSSVVIDGSKTINLNHDVYEIICEFEQGAKYNDIEVELIDVQSRDIKNQLLEIEPAIEQEKEKILSKQGS